MGIKYANRAIALDPGLVAPRQLQARGLFNIGNYLEAESLYKESIRRAPHHAGLHVGYGQFLLHMGKIAEARKHLDLAAELNPLSAGYAGALARVALQFDDDVTTEKLIGTAKDMGWGAADLIADYYWKKKRNYKKAIDAMRGDFNYLMGDASSSLNYAEYMQAVETRTPTPEAIDFIKTVAKLIKHPKFWKMRGYLEIGELDKAFAEFPLPLESGDPQVLNKLWLPHIAYARRSESFKKMVSRFGLVAYWHQSGWPDYCRPLSDTDFICE